jgi:homoserine kinase
MKVINQPVEVVVQHEHPIGSGLGGSGVSAVCYVELKVGE